MAKRTVTTETTEDEHDTDREKSEKDELPEDVIRALVELEGADDIRWVVTRKSQPNAGYAGELSTSELSLYRIAQDYGPGRYQIRGIKPDGTYYKSATVPIAEPVRRDNTLAMADLLKKTNNNDSTMLPLVMAMMQNSTQVMVAALNRQPAAPAQNKEFPWPALLSSMPAILVAIKEFTKNNNDADSMEKILKQLTILEKLKGTDKESSWPDVVRELAGSIPSMIGTVRNGGSTPTTVTQVPNMDQPAVDVAGELPQSLPSGEDMTLLTFLRERLADLIAAAMRNRNPELQAELLLEEITTLPKMIQQQLISMLTTRDDWFEQLCAFNPSAQHYRGWFENLRNDLISLLQSEDVSEVHEASQNE